MKSIVKAVGYIVVYFLFQLLVSILFSTFAVSRGANDEKEIAEYIMNNTLLTTILANFLTLAVFVLFRKLHKHSKIKLIDFRGIVWKKCILCAVIAFAFSMCFSLITYNVSFENGQLLSQSAAYYSKYGSLLGTSMMMIALLLSAPITEEYICRGILFSELQKNFSPALTIILSGVIFGVMHILAGGIILAIGATLMGLLLGNIYYMTKSLTVAVIAHSCANLPDFILGYLPGLNTLAISVMAVVFLIIAAVCMLYFHKHQTACG